MAKKKVVKKEEDVYNATLLNFGKRFTSTGSTITEAIANLQPGNVKARAILTLEHNGKTQEKILQPFLVSKLFTAQGLSREVALKNASTLFSL